MKSLTLSALFLLALVFALTTGCSTAPTTTEGRSTLESDARVTVDQFKQSDPSLADSFFKSAKAYAVFPTIGKGAIGVGGAYGKGVLFEGGSIVGYCDMTQGSIGFQLGGQAYSELVFFENQKVLNDFKAGTVEFAAQASAVAAASGAGANAKYDRGVAVFTLGEKGLMYEASVGGQKFDYLAK
ncbi:MAG: hypothetical protein GC164_14825 [Phycisphaera sp.]|nr:hypothetical protein [Phycisphaera sp.]